MSQVRIRFRELLSGPGQIVVPEALTAGMARMAELAGFEAVYMGGHALSVLNLAIPDHGLIYPTEIAEYARRIADAVYIPIICDADQCGETALNVHRAIRDYENAGVSAIHIEDTYNPKHLYPDDELVPVELMQARIKAAVDARRDPNFAIIARTDCAYIKGPTEETIRRGIAYAEAGADAYFACRMGAGEIEQVCREVPIPVIDMNHHRTVYEKTGLKMNLNAGMTLRGILIKQHEMLEELRENGMVAWAGNDLLGMPGSLGLMDQLIRDPDYLRVAELWAPFAGGRKQAG